MSPEPVKAPSAAPVTRYHRMMDRLRELRTPHELKPPAGLGCFMMIFAVMVLIASLAGPSRELIHGSTPGNLASDAPPIGMRACLPLSSVWVAIMGTIYAFQPRKRWFGYVLLTMVFFNMLILLVVAMRQ